MGTLDNRDFEMINRIFDHMASCIMGKDQEVKLVLTALLAQGHVLLEDVPGTGKTVLIKSLARSVQGVFHRIQCNPDLLPTDITGVSIYHPRQETFIFRPGPVMANILLVDEINRATTKTQSALLEAMEEKHVSVDGESYPLPDPFLLLATQNPIDFEGTYVLPEAQMDRFMLKFSLGYPDEETELKMAETQSISHPLDQIEAVTDIDTIRNIQHKIQSVHIDQAVMHYAVKLVRKTREHPAIYLGASPRATLSLIQASKAYAALEQRNYVIPDDIKFLSTFALAHRLILQSEARMERKSPKSVLQSIVNDLEVPVRLEKA